VGLIPRDKCQKQPQAGDLIVALGGRTGRDGIHGATFSSAELTSDSETISGGAVQIGNAITEKMMMDVLLAARDRGLYHAVTDCGAGGFSSAVGEMGEQIGALVWLERVPLKYEGLSYTEIWISEAQERMVLAVPPDKWDEFAALCRSEQVEATVIGEFVPTGRLQLTYQGNTVGDLSMEFLHEGRPPVVRDAVFQPPPLAAWQLPTKSRANFTGDLKSLLSSLNIASKHWIIRQYDHEVLGGSVIKPLVGIDADGPSDAAVVRPRLDTRRGLVISCGMNPSYGDFDPYAMATSGIDEAVRNCVAVGADPARIALLDNFCWGYTDRPETLGSLVRAAVACHDLAVAWGCPFISGKDSLNNEFSYADGAGQRVTIRIPATLLISALGQVDDVAHCVTMDFKQAGNLVYVVGTTYPELGGSHFGLVRGATGGLVPVVRPKAAEQVFARVHAAIRQGLVRSCHDPSEGGLAVALAEMALAGGLGAQLDLEHAPREDADAGIAEEIVLLFAESNSRLVCEVPAQRAVEFEQLMLGVACGKLGTITQLPRLVITDKSRKLIDADVSELKQAWQKPLDW
jgi:phosphoribosylformylglycinamidine synthase